MEENKYTYLGAFSEYKGFYGSILMDENDNLWGYINNTKDNINIEYKIEGDSLSKLYDEYKKTVNKHIAELKAKELDKPLLKIDIQWSLQTDGDYRLDNADLYDAYTSYEHYSGSKVFISSNDDNTRYEAKSFLEELLCDIRYNSSHYYIMKYILEMFENSMKFISNRDNYGFNLEYVGGNYDGTQIHIKITRIEREEEEECDGN